MSRVLARPIDTRTIALSVAGVLALGTGVLTFNYLSSVGHANAPVAQRTVVVAAKRIAARTTLTADMLTTAQRPANAIDPDVLAAPASAVGAIAANDIPAGSQLTSSKLLRAAATAFPSRVRRGMRAVAIPIDKVKSVSNLLQPGDIVDVIAVTSPRTGETPRASTIIRGARVLSVNQMIDTSVNPSPAPETGSYASSTATLELTPAQADLIALADVNATLRLALRPPDEALKSQPVEKMSFTGGGQSSIKIPTPVGPVTVPQTLPQVAPKPVPAPPTAKPVPVNPVAVIEGDKIVSPGSGK